MSAWPTATVLVPLLTAALTAFTAGLPRLQKSLSWTGMLVWCGVAAAALASAFGGASAAPASGVGFGHWPMPFAIGLRLDGVGALLTAIAALMGAATLLYLESDVDRPPPQPVQLPLVHGLLAGVAGAFATDDLFNLYVWFEVMLVCALGLLALAGGRRQTDATLRYLTLNLIGTLLLLGAVALLYASTGHLNHAALHSALASLSPGLRDALLALLLLALLIKAGAFPVAAWLPASYPTLPAPLLMLFAGLLTKVGAYAVLRMVGQVFAPASPWLMEALGWVACATMLSGVLGAAYHWDLRRIFAFHIISQIGYILLAIALGGLAGHTAALFYTVHHILVKGNLFLVCGLIFAHAGSYDLRRLGGLQAARPWLAAAFAIPALSLVGIPPLSGFWAKWLVLQVALQQGRWAWALVAVGVSLLTMYSMLKVWQEAFWKPRPDAGLPDLAASAHTAPATAWPAYAAVALLTLATTVLSLWPEALLPHARAAAAALSLTGRP